MAAIREQIERRIGGGILGGTLGLAVMSGGVAAADLTASEAVRCEIQVNEHGGGVALEGVVKAKSAIKGSYELVVTKSGGGGSSNINQSGEFSSAAGQDTSIGTVMLAGDEGSYTAKLKIMWGDRSTECREKVRGSL